MRFATKRLSVAVCSNPNSFSSIFSISSKRNPKNKQFCRRKGEFLGIELKNKAILLGMGLKIKKGRIETLFSFKSASC